MAWLGNLKYILCCHFDERKSEISPGGKVSRQRWRVRRGGCHLRKLKAAILKKKYIDCMVLNLKLTVYIRNAISFSYKPKTQWNSDVSNFFSEIFKFWPIFHWKSVILSSAMIMTFLTSYLGCWYLFWYVWKEETLSYTM